MFSALILALVVLATRVESGLYPYPNAVNQDQEPQAIVQNVPVKQEVSYEVPEKSISYSISANDYNYLKLLKNGQDDTRFNTNNLDGQVTAINKHLPCNKHPHSYENVISNEADNILSTQANFVQVHNPTPAVQPIVKKYIYFHVPPPEMEEESVYVKPVQPSKKTYNIIFIKAPSQNYYSYANNVQSLFRNQQQASVEEKTLIYVLVKKPEPQPEVLLPDAPKSSEHEVYYVKYKNTPGDLANQLSNLGTSNAEEVASVINSGGVSHHVA